jgi:hypothetical protein
LKSVNLFDKVIFFSFFQYNKNDSGNSGEHILSPENESLSPYLDDLSPASSELSPEGNRDLSTKSNDSGDTGHIGDKIGYLMERQGRCF